MTSALQNASRAGAKWEDMSRSAKVLRITPWINCGPDRLRPIVGGNSSCHTTNLRINRDRERGAAPRRVIWHHRIELQLVEPLAGHGQTDQTSSVGCHEV